LLKSSSMAQGFSLRRNFSWTLFGNVFYSACQWGILVVLTKVGTSEMVGTFTFAFAVTAPLFMFFNLQLRVVQATDARTQFTFNDYLGLRLVSTTMALAILVFIAGMLSDERSIVVLIIGIAKAIESMSDVCYGYMQQHERMDFIAFSLMGRGALSLILVGVGIMTSGTVIGAVSGLAVAWIVMLLGYDLRVMRQFTKMFADLGFQNLEPAWQWQTQKKLIGLTLPLGFVMLLISLSTNIPRYFIEHFLSPRELGIFAAIAYLTSIGSIIQGALAQAASPQLAKFYASDNRRSLVSLLLKLIGLSCIFGLASIILSKTIGQDILRLVYKPEYAKHTNLLILLMIAASLNYISSFLGTAITSVRYFRSQVPMICTTLLIMVIGCFYLIPIWGVEGVPATMIIAEIIQIIMFTSVLNYALKH
jgi:O-antigen/teichoic acid export membrane protein